MSRKRTKHRRTKVSRHRRRNPVLSVRRPKPGMRVRGRRANPRHRGHIQKPAWLSPEAQRAWDLWNGTRRYLTEAVKKGYSLSSQDREALAWYKRAYLMELEDQEDMERPAWTYFVDKARASANPRRRGPLQRPAWLSPAAEKAWNLYEGHRKYMAEATRKGYHVSDDARQALRMYKDDYLSELEDQETLERPAWTHFVDKARASANPRRTARNGFAGHDFAKAKKQAQASANYNGVSYVLFRDTSGNLRIEPLASAGTYAATNGIVFRPNTSAIRRAGTTYGHRLNPSAYLPATDVYRVNQHIVRWPDGTWHLMSAQSRRYLSKRSFKTMSDAQAALAKIYKRGGRNPQFYRTFKRSATGWQSFSRARKMTQDTGLTWAQAREACDRYNSSRTPAQVRKGTKLEFEAM